jgi:outer membrane lipoprotein-sorting protein
MVLFLAALLFLPLAVSAQSVDDILEKYIAARGGLAKIKAIQSERVTGTIVFSPEVQGPFVVERERPLKLHMEVTLGRETVIRVYDGKGAGWIYNPFVSNPAVASMTESDLRNIMDEADFEGPFISYKSKGNQLEYLGKTTVEGKPAYKIKLTNKNGEVSYFSFDAATYLVVRWQGTRKDAEGKEVASESFFRDYREINDVQYPFLIESTSQTPGASQKIIADKIEVNVSISESRFKKPLVAGAETETPATAAPPAAAPSKPN